MVELIEEFVLNFELSRNAKEPRFSKRPKKPKQVKHRKFAEYRILVISLFPRTKF